MDGRLAFVLDISTPSLKDRDTQKALDNCMDLGLVISAVEYTLTISSTSYDTLI